MATPSKADKIASLLIGIAIFMATATTAFGAGAIAIALSSQYESSCSYGAEGKTCTSKFEYKGIGALSLPSFQVIAGSASTGIGIILAIKSGNFKRGLSQWLHSSQSTPQAQDTTSSN
jgi:hypothetical protein